MSTSDIRAPIACVITFRTYGTWLHGDERESVDRAHNVYGTARLPLNPPRLSFEERMLVQPPVYLGPARRAAANEAVRETCAIRKWPLFALNVRTNHLHIVAATDIPARRAMVAFKANATRAMRESGCWTLDRSPWARGGSAKLIWSLAALERTIHYVVSRQGVDL